MNKSLEALESLIFLCKNIQNGTNMIFNTTEILNKLNTIKQEIERLQQLQKEIAELKDQVDYFKEEFEGWQSACEWAEAKNAILKLENKELKEIIKENFFYHKNSEEIGYRKPMPKYQDKIKEVLEDE